MSSELPARPDDGYDWNRFCADQAGVPWIFHGTSTIHELGIREHGLAFTKRPYDNDEVGRVVQILESRKLYGRVGELGVLAAFTASTAEAQSISVTFDWIRACTYAVLNRGGETLEYLTRCLEWAMEPDQARLLSSSERDFLSGILTRVEPVAQGHIPLVVAIQMPTVWYESLPFFASRTAFEANRGVLLSARDEFLGIHPDPEARDGRTRLIHGGIEFRVSEVSVDQLRAFIRLPSGAPLRNLLRRL